MATKVVKGQHEYPIFSFCFFMIGIVLLIIQIIYDITYLSWFIIICIIIGILLYIKHIRTLKTELKILIDTTQKIIDNQSIELTQIDSESYISVLSSSLFILDTRMKGMIDQLNKEQLKLKDYIEDISHQIKTPLTSMMLREEMLLETVENSKEKDIILQIYKQTEKIKELTETLLHLAQIDSHTIIYHKNEYKLIDILENINEVLTPLKEQYQVDFNIKDAGYNIYCDEKWMSEAIENILKNCIEQKSNSNIDIYCKNYSSFIEIYIQDYGQGFLEEERKHIFERFYQGKVKKTKGVGIGLALSKGIIEGHYGTIEAINNNGALFKIILPHKNMKSKYTVTE